MEVVYHPVCSLWENFPLCQDLTKTLQPQPGFLLAKGGGGLAAGVLMFLAVTVVALPIVMLALSTASLTFSSGMAAMVSARSASCETVMEGSFASASWRYVLGRALDEGVRWKIKQSCLVGSDGASGSAAH